MTELSRLSGWPLRCGICNADGVELQDVQATCPTCGGVLPIKDGIADFLAMRGDHSFDVFVTEYRRIRALEGRLDHPASVYRALPDYTLDDAHTAIWAIRRRSMARLAAFLASDVAPGARILDLGSGNGWLCHRLAQLGHFPLAVDINTDPDDGLGAVRHYSFGWPSIRGSFDHLALSDGSVDLVIYNGSFHYTDDDTSTLREARRVLRPGGRIVIMDSPIYSDPASGQRMVQERADAFSREFGHKAETKQAGYITHDAISKWEQTLDLSASLLRPAYGAKWALRPIFARLRGGREPATFALVVLSPC